MICCENVTSTQFDGRCKITPRKGGIPLVVAYNCQVDFTDITSTEEWQLAKDAGMVTVFPMGIGSKPETEKTKVLLVSCGNEQTVDITHTLNFRTHQADLQSNADFDKWAEVAEKAENYKFIYFDCNDVLYSDKDVNAGFMPTSFDLDHVTGETSNEPQSFNMILQFKHSPIVKGFAGSAIKNILLANSNS